jgi:3-methyladenine DNA glycosylase AlkD
VIISYNLSMKFQDIIKAIKSQYNKKNIEGLARFGINPHNTYGASIPFLRELAKKIGKDHELAERLWDSDIHEARMLAGMVDVPTLVTSSQMDKWTSQFNSWDVCDQMCSNLYDKTRFAYQKAFKWPEDKREYVKRAGYVMMAVLAVHDKFASDKTFEKFYPLILKGVSDERNFVKKAVNWAIRQIGKRDPKLRKSAIKLSKKILKIDSKSARWIASDALRELTSI